MPFDKGLYDTQLSWMEEGTALFGQALDRVSDSEVSMPSLLRSWTRAHLVSHVNSNARALVNLAQWAKTGVETPMYESNEQRSREIDEGALKTLGQLKSEYNSSSSQLWSSISTLPPERLEFQVKSARGRDIPVYEIVWMRNREIWVHSVDLGVGIGFERFPIRLTIALIDEVVNYIANSDMSAQIVIDASDLSRSWSTADSSDAIQIEGNSSNLLAWMIGRSQGDGLRVVSSGGALPNLPNWL